MTNLQTIGEQAFGPRQVLRDESGAVRVVLDGRSWDEHLELAVVEIRVYGVSAPQVTRRLRAMLESLAERVRPERRAAVLERLAQLARSDVDADERAFASRADRQGIGSA